MYLNKQTLVHYQDVFQRMKEDGSSRTNNNKTEVQAFLTLLSHALEHINKENKLRRMIEGLYDEYGGDHAGSMFNIATTRGSSLLLVESWYDDIKLIEGQFMKLQDSITTFLGSDPHSSNSKVQINSIIFLCSSILKESELLANRMKKFFREEHYQHSLFDKKDPDEAESNLLSWLS